MSNLLNKSLIQAQLNSHNIQLDFFDEINSTNEYLKNAQKIDKIHVCLAESQTAGRGRLQREWHSPFGENIYLSLRCTINKKAAELGGLSLLVGLSVCEILDGIPNIKLKWPNDVYHEDKKMAGCLIELLPNSELVIGLGLNVNMEKANLDRAWTSLKIISGQEQDRNALIAKLIDKLIHNLKIFEEQGFEPFLAAYQQYDYSFNKMLTLQSGNKQYQGIARGINNEGHLALFCENELRYFSSGEVVSTRLI